MRLCIPDVAVLLIALTVGGLALYRGGAIIAAICLVIGAAYAAVIVRGRRNPGDKR